MCSAGEGRMIEKAPVSKQLRTYSEALLYCQFLSYNDHIDWRLPTADEYRQFDLWGWYYDDPLANTDRGPYQVIAVRDI